MPNDTKLQIESEGLGDDSQDFILSNIANKFYSSIKKKTSLDPKI